MNYYIDNMLHSWAIKLLRGDDGSSNLSSRFSEAEKSLILNSGLKFQVDYAIATKYSTEQL